MNTSIINVAETFGLSENQSMGGTSPLVRRNYAPQRAKAIVEAAGMWKRVFDGDPRAALQVREALSTSDLFKSVTGDVLDRELLAQYADITPEWQSFATRTVVRNFKPKKLIDILGGKSALDLVPELHEYPSAESDSREYEIAVKKFGRRFGFSWEAMVNDDLDELAQIPGRFSSAAALTEDNAALEQIVDPATGAANTAFFKTANGNAVVTAVLDHDNLSTAITTVSTRTDDEDNIVAPDNGLILVVGPAQEMNARRLLNATEVRVTNGSKTTLEPNWLKGAVELVVLKRLKGTGWFVLPKPNTGRPAVAVAFLRGWETPDIRIKADGGQRIGGGQVDPTEGSFDEDGVFYRVRHVTGGAQVDPIHTYAATGTAS